MYGVSGLVGLVKQVSWSRRVDIMGFELPHVLRKVFCGIVGSYITSFGSFQANTKILKTNKCYLSDFEVL